MLSFHLEETTTSRLPMSLSVEQGQMSDNVSGELGMSRQQDLREIWETYMQSSRAQGADK